MRYYNLSAYNGAWFRDRWMASDSHARKVLARWIRMFGPRFKHSLSKWSLAYHMATETDVWAQVSFYPTCPVSQVVLAKPRVKLTQFVHEAIHEQLR